MKRATMVALIGLLLAGCLKAPFGPNDVTFDPKTGLYNANTPVDTTVSASASEAP